MTRARTGVAIGLLGVMAGAAVLAVGPARQHGPAPSYRANLVAAVSACCPDLRMPAARDIRAPWTLAPMNFLVAGDFNGDGQDDAAIILIDGGGTPQLAIFAGRAGRYALAHQRSLARVDDVAITSPAHVVLRVVKRGERWAPEAGDVRRDFPHEFDAVEFATAQPSSGGGVEARLHLLYWEGTRYAEY